MKSAATALLISVFAIGHSGVGTTTARTWHVPADAPTIQAGLDSAGVGDAVEVSCGTYFESGIVMKAGVDLLSETGGPGCVTIDAAQQNRVILCQDLVEEASIVGFTITGGRMPDAADYGGGVLCVNSALTIAHCDFIDNYAGYAGGGLACDQGAPVVVYCRFIANEGYMGGGGMHCNSSDAQISHCWFEANIATDGAGLYCNRSSPDVEWCTFLNNDGLFFGGGIFCHFRASPTFRHCSIVGNEAYLGGGIMTVAHSFPTMENSIIAFSAEGEGVHCYDGLGAPTYLHISCSDVYGNAGGGYTGWIEDQTGLNGNIAADPLFCDLAAGDLSLAADSPCLPTHNDCDELMGAAEEGCPATPVAGGLPRSLRLLPNHPNPFNPATAWRLELPRDGMVEVAVHTLDGRRVRTLVRSELAAGSHVVTWDGLDAAGRALPSGTYLVRLQTETGVRTSKATLVR